jgi:hypothetical protein
MWSSPRRPWTALFLRQIEESDAKPGELAAPDVSAVSDPAEQDLLLRAYRLSLIGEVST